MYSPIYPPCRGRYGSNYWEVYSPKIKRIVKLFSDLEYDHWLLVEANPIVREFCEQPKKIVRPFNGKRVKTIFDMWILYEDGLEKFIEVKYLKDLDPNNPKAIRAITQTTVQRAWCQDEGFNYEIKTEKDIRSNRVLLTNIKQIIPYLRHRNHAIDTDRYRVLRLVKTGPVTLGQILLRLRDLPPSRVQESVFWLIYEGTLKSSIDQKQIDRSMEVWINDQKKDY